MRKKAVYRPICGCGKCEYCRQSQRRAWAKRMMAEWRYGYRFAYFLTLTYDDFSIPLTSDSDSMIVRPDVSKRDVQLFLKRFRKRFERVTGHIRYFCVSELGDQTLRPHYHIILFTEKPVTKTELKAMMLATWQNGVILDASVVRSNAAFYYISNYLYKQTGNCQMFRLSSRRPALGLAYISARRRWHHKSGWLHDRCYFPLASHDGNFASLPRYLKDRLYSKSERQYIRDYHSREQADALRDFMRSKGLKTQKGVDEFNRSYVANECIKIRKQLKQKHHVS